MEQGSDRRNHIRYPGQNLLLEVDGALYPLIDISTGGLSFEGGGFRQRQSVTIKVSSVLDAANSMAAPCDVVTVDGVRVGVAFARPTLPLLAYVIGHIGAVTGITPCVVKRDVASLS